MKIIDYKVVEEWHVKALLAGGWEPWASPYMDSVGRNWQAMVLMEDNEGGMIPGLTLSDSNDLRETIAINLENAKKAKELAGKFTPVYICFSCKELTGNPSSHVCFKEGI